MTPGTLQGLVDRLGALSPEDVTPAAIAQLLGGWDVCAESLAPFLHFDSQKYARNLVHRGALFDVIVLCWRPGQATLIHDHSGQLGWVRVLRGRMRERLFELREPGASGAPLQCVSNGIVTAGRAVVGVDDQRSIHALDNPTDDGESPEDAVTLHLYSRPHDSCYRYDPGTGERSRMALAFDSQPRG